MAFCVTIDELRLKVTAQEDQAPSFVGKDGAECWIRCSWKSGCAASGLKDDWKESSRSWRNVHPLQEYEGKLADEEKCVEEKISEQEEKLSEQEEKSPQVETSCYRSSRYWFQQRGSLGELSDEFVTKFYNNRTLNLSVYEGKTPGQEEILLGSTDVSLECLFRGENLSSVVALDTQDAPCIDSLEILLNIVLDDSFVDYLIGSRILCLETCELNDVAETFRQEFVDPLLEANKGDEGTAPFSEQQLESLQESVRQAHKTVQTVLNITEMQGKEKEFLQLVGRKKVVVFDVESGAWSAVDDEEESKRNCLFLSRGTIKRLLSTSDLAAVQTTTTHIKPEVPVSEVDSKKKGKKDTKAAEPEEETPCVVTSQINLQELLRPGVTSCKVESACGQVAVQVSTCIPILDPNVFPELSLDVPDVALHASLSKATTDVSSLIKPSTGKQHLLEEIRRLMLGDHSRDRKDQIRLLIIQMLEEDRDLQESFLGSKSSLRLCSELYALLNTWSVDNSEAVVNLLEEEKRDLPHLLTRLVQNAANAEFVGNFCRADDLWRKCICLSDTALISYAKFCMQRQRISKAIELLLRCQTTLEEKEGDEHFYLGRLLCEGGYVFVRDTIENDPSFLLDLCRYEMGNEDCLDFSCEQTQDTGIITSNLRTVAKTALGFSMAKVAKKCIICANALDETPLHDDDFVKNEIMRAQYKASMGKYQPAADILKTLCDDNENICLINISELVRAETLYLLGLYTGKADGKPGLESRAAYSEAIGILNSIDRQTPASNDLRLKVIFHLGSMALGLEDYRKARISFRNATSLVDQVGPIPWAWVGLGVSNMMLGELKDADIALKRAVILDDTDPVTWGHIACLQVLCNNSAEASIAIKLALGNGLECPDILPRLLATIESSSFCDKERSALKEIVRERIDLVNGQLTIQD